MKKQSLKSLQLRKKSISNLKSFASVGGSGTCRYESVIICPEPDSAGVDCNTNATGCQTFFSYCAC
ncbi:MAG: hypothetical protein AB8B65_01565 [Kordia sp.]|uniref:hypothetical protein n=1 Tax=Kordia sp. TaxID=1965332 RepID=UPI00385C5F43